MTKTVFDENRKTLMTNYSKIFRKFGRANINKIASILSYHTITESERKRISAVDAKKGYVVRVIESRFKHFKLDVNLCTKYFDLKKSIEYISKSSIMSTNPTMMETERKRLTDQKYMIFEILLKSMYDEVYFRLSRAGVIDEILTDVN